MSDVTGPIRTLPGALYNSPKGLLCDECGKLPATIRVQGETDSFGAEMHDFCQSCHEKEQQRMREYREQRKKEVAWCDWCKEETTAGDLKSMRDDEEGLCGPVYQVCKSCRDRYERQFDNDRRDW